MKIEELGNVNVGKYYPDEEGVSDFGDTVMMLEGLDDVGIVPLVVGGAVAYEKYKEKKRREAKRKAQEKAKRDAEYRAKIEAERRRNLIEYQKKLADAIEKYAKSKLGFLKFLDSSVKNWIDGAYIPYVPKSPGSVTKVKDPDYITVHRELLGIYRGIIEKKFVPAPTKWVSAPDIRTRLTNRLRYWNAKKFAEETKKLAKKQEEQVNKNINVLENQVAEQEQKFKELQSKFKEAEKLNDEKTGKQIAVPMLKLAKGLALKKMRLAGYKAHKLYLDKTQETTDKFEQKIDKGDFDVENEVKDIVANQVGVGAVSKGIENIQVAQKTLGDKDELDVKQAELQRLEEEKKTYEQMAQTDPDYVNVVAETDEKINQLKSDIEKLKPQVEQGMEYLEQSGELQPVVGEEGEVEESQISELAGIDIGELTELAGIGSFFKSVGKGIGKALNVATTPAKWVLNKAGDIAGFVGKQAGKAIAPIMGSLFGGGGGAVPQMPSDIPMSPEVAGQAPGGGMKKWLLIGGAGIVGLGAVYFLTRKK